MVLTISPGGKDYDVTVGPGCIDRASELFDLDRKCLVVTDDGVPASYSERIADQCKEAVVVTLPQGEESKSMANLEKLLTTMLEHSFTRSDCVVAVGGGMPGDLAGFSAATYMRGIDFYNVPTTLLSQADSSIGGKTAVDLAGVKNIVGAFHQPCGVLIDTDTLETLSPRQRAAARKIVTPLRTLGWIWVVLFSSLGSRTFTATSTPMITMITMVERALIVGLIRLVML